MKKISMGQIIHFGIIYLLLSFFILGSIYNRSFLENLGFGFFYTLSWLCCFLIPSLIYTDPDFNQFSFNKNYPLKRLVFSVFFWLFQLVFILVGLQLLHYNLMLINLMGAVGLLFYALTIVVSNTPLTIKDNQVDPLFLIVKALTSTYLIWYFLYLGLMIIVLNFSPKAETILFQLGLICLPILALFITSHLAVARLPRLILCCIIGFFIMAIEIAYFSNFLDNKTGSIQSVPASSNELRIY